MPFIGEQPAEAASLYVPARSGTTIEILLEQGVITVTTRTGVVNVGVE